MQSVSFPFLLRLWQGSLLGVWGLGNTVLAQQLPPGLPNNPPNPILPPPIEAPDEEPLPPPNEILTPTAPQSPITPLPEAPDQITVQGFRVMGSTVFSDAELNEVTAPYTNRPITFTELLEARSAITKLYVDRGYITSGAFIPAGQIIDNGIVTINVIEGSLEAIAVKGNKRLNSSYIRSRIRGAARPPLNVDRLLESLQLLQLDPLIGNLSAELSASSQPGLSLLEVTITEADSFRVDVDLNNLRSPSIGSFQRQIQVEELNVLGFGDAARLAYANTDGSNQVNVGYTVPVNAKNGTVSINFSQVWSKVVEAPFDVLNITGVSRDLNVAYRQPIIRKPDQEFALGLTVARRESETFLQPEGFEKIRFPFAGSGSDENGRLRVTELRFSQDFTQRDRTTVFALRSEFALGLNALGATNNAVAPDGQFFLWRGQAQWVKRLAPDTLFLARSNVQFADRPLPSLAQFGLGGGDSVRGYRQDLLLVDNGIFGSAEVRIPILRVARRKGILHLVPFLDVGHGWDLSPAIGGGDTSNTLFSGGIGLRWQWSDRLTARLDWGIPFLDVGTQESGFNNSRVFFSITATPF
ncbi:MAG: ShlB/FhaC/HecB family hemolysin secretion/activation protein [Thermosynechococcaceae cyanobacterium]